MRKKLSFFLAAVISIPVILYIIGYLFMKSSFATGNDNVFEEKVSISQGFDKYGASVFISNTDVQKSIINISINDNGDKNTIIEVHKYIGDIPESKPYEIESNIYDTMTKDNKDLELVDSTTYEKIGNYEIDFSSYEYGFYLVRVLSESDDLVGDYEERIEFSKSCLNYYKIKDRYPVISKFLFRIYGINKSKYDKAYML